ncbi:MAG: molybdopterin-guanine dinucleotide biosynthesis protein B [Phycisphaerae bacterium]
MALPPILCVAGPSGSGKTTLLERMIPALAVGGLRAGVVKRASVELTFDAEGKDSSRLARAGAAASIASGTSGLVAHGRLDMALLDLAALCGPACDMVLAEGFKHSPLDKIAVLAAGDSSPPPADWPAVGLVVADQAGRPAGAVGRNDIAGVSAWVRAWFDRRKRLGEGVMGALLVGGRSSRMGADKAGMQVRGRAVLPNLAEMLGGLLGEVWLIGGPARGIGMPKCVRWHLDIQYGRTGGIEEGRKGGREDGRMGGWEDGRMGPLGGIATALRVAAVAGASAALIVACDMPALTGRLLDFLLENRRRDSSATILRNPITERLEPLAGIYEQRALGPIEEALDRGELSVTDLLRSIPAHVIDAPAEMAAELANINTPQELREAELKPPP